MNLLKKKILDILINNAGLMGVPYEVTKDDYEIQYQVNFVAHYLLTLKLLPFYSQLLKLVLHQELSIWLLLDIIFNLNILL